MCLVKKINNVTNELQLHDVWRINNPNKKIYTLCRKNPFTARRLDNIFTSTSLFYCCRDAGVKNIGFSDHKICTLILDFSLCTTSDPSGNECFSEADSIGWVCT